MEFTIAEKGELRWVSRVLSAKQQLCFDVTCDYPGIEVWEVEPGEWRCHVRASKYEALAISYDGGTTAEEAVRFGLEKLAAKNETPQSLPGFVEAALKRHLEAYR